MANNKLVYEPLTEIETTINLAIWLSVTEGGDLDGYIAGKNAPGLNLKLLPPIK